MHILQFNDYGNTICVQDDKGNAVYGEYTVNNYDEGTSVTGAARKNQLTLSSITQSTTGNKFSDPTLQNWSTYWKEMAQYTSGVVETNTSEYHTGSESIKFSRNSTSSTPGIVYNFTDYIYINPGESYTFSAYVKTTSAIDGNFYLSLSTSYSGQIHSDYVSNTSGQWTRISVTYTHTGTSQARIYPYLVLNGNGTIYIDSLQLEESKTATRFNIVRNSDFASSNTSSGILGWDLSDSTRISRVNISSATDTLDNNVIKMEGDPNSRAYASQEISISGKSGDTFVVSAWAKADSARLGEVQTYAQDRMFGIKVQLYNNSNLISQDIFSFNPDIDSTNNWQYLAEEVKVNGTVTSIKITLLYDFNLNTAYFDGIQIYREKFGTEYTYNTDANISQIIDANGGETTLTYTTQNKNNIETVKLPDKTEYGYVYNAYNQVIKETTPEGIVYSYVYDDYGNNIKSFVGTTSNPKQIGIEAQYTFNGEYLSWITDTVGNKTRYGYDTATGRLIWVQYPNDTTSTRTEYKYDSRGRLVSTSKSNGTATLKETNAYSEGMLSVLTHTGQSATDDTDYSFLYNNCDLISSVKVGSRTLASYTYNNAYEKQLTTLVYGNGHSINYVYDEHGRTSSITYGSNGNSGLTYTYDQEGRLSEVTDSDAATITKYVYDETGRLEKYRITSGNNVLYQEEYSYNQLNNVTGIKAIVNDKFLISNYSYNDNNVLTEIAETFGSNSISQRQVYAYDTLGRLATIYSKEGATNVVTTSLDYKAPNNSHASSMLVSTTTVVSQWINTYGGTTSSYYYEYDGNGNITEISPDNVFNDGDGVEFQYDSINQLTRVNDKINNETWVYTYDLGGNITSKKRYAYTTGTLGSVLETVSYSYTDSSWADLLTSYNGKSITYDAIGNTLSDGTWTYTWARGRQLASQNDGTTTWSYTYDATGQRLTKSNGTLTYHYIYNDMQLMYMKVKNGSTVVCEMYFQYGQLGLMAIQYISSSLTDTYYVVTNAQGDVVALVDGSGTKVVEYTYDAWGKLTNMTGSKVGTVGKYNPIRYRDYVYDTETQLYYLNTRYYNPDMCRFINADGYASTGDELTGSNMFAYCANNPVNMTDPTGELPDWANKWIAIVTVATVVAVATTITVMTYGAGSVAGVAMISATLTLLAKTTEVAVLQVKKGVLEEDDSNQITQDTIEAIYDNGLKIIGFTPFTKTVGIGANHFLTATVVKDFGGIQTLNQTLQSTGGKAMPYAFAAIAWVNTINSAFSNDPESRAKSRGYVLK
ncbi:MAG: hypothetical protein IKV30_00695 [Clostridia bacterium]|nr:hypothetical protein [Clostridia bacterium]